MSWIVAIGVEFEPEFAGFDEDVQTEILALARLLQQIGPQLGRPRVDTLNGSRHANMKELRFSAADGEWRVAFAFDRKRKAVLLVAGDKSGAAERMSDSTHTLPGCIWKGSNDGNECERYH